MRHLLQRRDPLTHRPIAREAPGDGGRRVAVEAVELGRRAAFLDVNEVVEAHHVATCAANREISEVARSAAKVARQLRRDLVLPAIADEVTEPLAAERSLERARNVGRRHAERLGLVAVDGQAHLGLVELQAFCQRLATDRGSKRMLPKRGEREVLAFDLLKK